MLNYKDYFEEAVQTSKQSKCEEGVSNHPRVGAVLLYSDKGNIEMVTAARGEEVPCEHAEYTLLERRLQFKNLHNKEAKLFTTLEPCVERGEMKIPCVYRIIQRGIKKVWIGMLDPNPNIWGKGVWILKNNKIEVNYFSKKYRTKIEEMNKNFIDEQLARFSELEFQKELPHLFLDPDEPYLDAAYALFRMYKGSTIVFFNTKLRMFQNLHEFYAWWVNGILKNNNIKNIYILAQSEDINKNIIKSPIIKDLKEELKEQEGKRILVMKIEESKFIKEIEESMIIGIFFVNDKNGSPQVDYGLFLLPIPTIKEKRVILAIGRSAGYDKSLDKVRDEIYKPKYLTNETFKEIKHFLE